MNNRRGHVGTILLVIGAFLLVIFALYAMISSNSDLDLIKAELRSASDFAEANHKLVLMNSREIVNLSLLDSNSSSNFESDFKESLKKHASDKRVSGLSNNLYAKFSLGDYSLISKNGNYEIIVSDISEKYNLDNNEISYAYSLKITFDKNKVISVQEIMKESLYKVD